MVYRSGLAHRSIPEGIDQTAGIRLLSDRLLADPAAIPAISEDRNAESAAIIITVSFSPHLTAVWSWNGSTAFSLQTAFQARRLLKSGHRSAVKDKKSNGSGVWIGSELSLRLTGKSQMIGSKPIDLAIV